MISRAQPQTGTALAGLPTRPGISAGAARRRARRASPFASCLGVSSNKKDHRLVRRIALLVIVSLALVAGSWLVVRGLATPDQTPAPEPSATFNDPGAVRSPDSTTSA